MRGAAEPAQDVIAAFLERLAAGDADGLAGLFSERIDWRVPGDPRLPWVGRRSGRAEVAAYFDSLWDHLEPEQSVIELGCIVADGTEHVIFARFSHVAKATGRRFDTDVALRLTVRAGEISRLHLYEDTLAVSRAWAPPDR